MRYSDLLECWSTINKSFLRDVMSLITTIYITYVPQMNCKVATSRFGGVRDVTIDCLFSVSSSPPSVATDDNGNGTAAVLFTPRPNSYPNPNPDAFARCIPFLCCFPKLERVTLSGHAVLPDGTRDFLPFHATSINNTMLTSAAFEDDANQANIDQQDESTLTLQQHQSNLITTICDAYASGVIPTKTHFVDLLCTSVCPAKIKNGGIVLHTAQSERCRYCTRICQTFPAVDVKNALLESFEDSVLDRAFCLSSKKVIEVLVERRDGGGGGRQVLAEDTTFFMNSLLKGRFAIVRALLENNLLPDISRDEIEEKIAAATCNNNGRKLELPKALLERLVEVGTPLQEADFNLTMMNDVDMP